MSPHEASPAVTAALNQARRARRRGSHRKAMLLLRRAAFEEQNNVALWNRYAFSCMRGGRGEEAQKAFSRAIWLDRRAGNVRRASVTKKLAAQAREGLLDLN